jgi:hypothetical protein
LVSGKVVSHLFEVYLENFLIFVPTNHMTNKRRAFLIITSVSTGTLLSAFLLKMRYGELDSDKYLWLGTNLFMAVVLIAGIGWILVWRKRP